VDRSKNTALIPPGFGTPTSYLPNSGEYRTPNLVPGALDGGLVNQVGSVGNPNGDTSTDVMGNYPATSTSLDSAGFPTVSGGSSTDGQATAFTEVTSSFYYSNGSLGTLKIPSIGGNNYVKLRDIGQAVDFGVEYDAATNSVHIDTHSSYQEEVKQVAQTPVSPSATTLTEENVRSTIRALRDTYPTNTPTPHPTAPPATAPMGQPPATAQAGPLFAAIPPLGTFHGGGWTGQPGTKSGLVISLNTPIPPPIM